MRTTQIHTVESNTVQLETIPRHFVRDGIVCAQARKKKP